MVQRTYRFGDWSLDEQTRELRSAGRLKTLSPKIFDCIAYLIDHRQRAVGRDELIAAVWGRVEVADAQLRNLMRKVRQAVGDSGEGQLVIRTIPGFGFRWVAEVSVAAATQEAKTRPTQSSVASVRGRHGNEWLRSAALTNLSGFSLRLARRRPTALFISLALALALAAGVYDWHFRNGNSSNASISSAPTISPAIRDAIAVLPVDIIASNDSDQAWMRLGLMDLIANQLRSAALVVSPSSDIVALTRDDQAGHISIDRVRAATGARNVVATSLNRTDIGWTIELDLQGPDENSRTIKAYSTDAILAAREATNRLLDLLGKRLPDREGELSDVSAIELGQRIQAALLIGDFTSARHLLESAAPALLNTPELQLDAARIEVQAGNIESAREQLEKVLASSSSSEASPVFRARVLNRLGGVDFRLGQLDLAKQRFTESLALLEDRNDPITAGQAYTSRGGINILQGQYDGAEADFSRARTAFDFAGDTLNLAAVELNEGSLEAMRNRQAAALNLFESAVQHSERFGNGVTLVHALGNEISAYLDLLQPLKALALSDRLDQELARMDDSPDLRIVRAQQVAALIKNGHLKDARDRLDQLERSMDPAREIEVLGMVQGFHAELDLTSNAWQSAVDRVEHAPALSSALADPSMQSRIWLTRVRALRGLHQDAKAEAETQRFSEWARSQDITSVVLHARIAEAEQAWAQGQRLVACRRYDEALHAAHEGGVPADIAEVVTAYGDTLIGAGELDHASTVVGQAARWGDADFETALLQARLYHAMGSVEPWAIALDQARRLAGERPLPPEITVPPKRVAFIEKR